MKKILSKEEMVNVKMIGLVSEHMPTKQKEEEGYSDKSWELKVSISEYRDS